MAEENTCRCSDASPAVVADLPHLRHQGDPYDSPGQPRFHARSPWWLAWLKSSLGALRSTGRDSVREHDERPGTIGTRVLNRDSPTGPPACCQAQGGPVSVVWVIPEASARESVQAWNAAETAGTWLFCNLCGGDVL